MERAKGSRGSVRVVVVDDDHRILPLFERVLRPPEFQLFSFEDPCAGLMALRDIGPDVIVSAVAMNGLDGLLLQRAVRSSPQLRHVPFVFLATDPDAEQEARAALSGRDICLRKPLPVGELLARLRELAPERRRDPLEPAALTGFTDRSGLFALLKLCEDACLTGRFSLETGTRSLWVDWFAGKLIRTGVSGSGRGDPLALLLDSDGGRYAFEPRPIERPGAEPRRRERPDAKAGAGASSRHGLVGRFTVLEAGGHRLQVYTEGTHGPNFTITTVVASAGHGLRKVETCWPHPLKRSADYAVAKDEIDRQHDGVLSLVRGGGMLPQPRRAVWDVVGGGVEGALLLWVMSLLRELVREPLGTLPALALLRRTHQRSSARHPALACFEVGDDGRIVIEVPDAGLSRTTLSGARLPKGAVQGVATWAKALLAEAAELGAQTLPSLRKATRMLSRDLEEIGFYEPAAEPEAVRARSLASRP